MRILLAIDGSAHSEAAVEEIERRHLPPNSEVRVISVVQPLPYYLPPAYPGDVGSVNPYAEIESTSRCSCLSPRRFFARIHRRQLSPKSFTRWLFSESRTAG